MKINIFSFSFDKDAAQWMDEADGMRKIKTRANNSKDGK